MSLSRIKRKVMSNIRKDMKQHRFFEAALSEVSPRASATKLKQWLINLNRAKRKAMK